MSRTLIAAALAGVLMAPVVASAANDNDTALGSRFDQLDRNRDGYVSRDEAKDAAELNTRFSELDVNNDGKLSREEYGALGKTDRGATGATSRAERRNDPSTAK